MNLAYMVVSRFTARLTILGTKDDILALGSLCQPYFTFHQAEGPSHDIWTVVIGSALKSFDISFERIVLCPPDEPQRHILLSSEKRYIVIDEESSPWRIQHTLRIIRNLLRLILCVQQDLYLHGGVIEVSGKGIAYIGNKQSGKTSSICSWMVSNQEVAYITNDDLSLQVSTPEILALGWPRAIGVRWDTLENLGMLQPTLRQGYRHLSHPGNQYLFDTAENNPSRIYFYPQELVEICEQQILPQTQLKAIVFPAFLDRDLHEGILTRLEPETALILLQEHLLDVPDDYDRFLHRCFALPTTESHTHRLAKIVEKIPCYALYQSFSALEKGTGLVLSSVLT